jgi:hydroxyethylthiazole kinase-like uncharacterized protein yjeF
MINSYAFASKAIPLARNCGLSDDEAMDSTGKMAVALLTVDEMAAADKAAIAAGIPGATLMERAGRAVADSVARRGRPGAGVLVLCGPGNNGGDGFVAAKVLRERGLRVTLALAGARSDLRGDAAQAARSWPGTAERLDAVKPAEFDLIVDALFGAGLNRPLAGDVAAAVSAINASGRPIISVDVPSGLSGDSGVAAGPVVRAAETVTFFRLKPGHLLQPGRSLCGVVTLADIGISADTAFGGGRRPSAFRNHPALWREHWPVHGLDTHKYQRGSVLVVAGGLSGVGAPRLGARAALRAGAGLVTIACHSDALAAHAARGPDALMQRPIPDASTLSTLLADKRLSAVLAGPALGLDAGARELVMSVLRAGVPAVVDADALTLLAARPASIRRLCEKRGAPCVLTPHEGEFVRVFGGQDGIRYAPSKLERARRAAVFSGAVIVLKGPDTVIAHPDGRAAINATGSAALATAGAGDVLGGLIAGLLAQGMPAFDAACAAVWLHGKAGEALGTGLIADDLPEAIPPLARALVTGDDFEAS